LKEDDGLEGGLYLGERSTFNAKRFWYDYRIGYAGHLLQTRSEFGVHLLAFVAGIVVEKRVNLVEALVVQFVYTSIGDGLWKLETRDFLQDALE
jgi:hypothetical protein